MVGTATGRRVWREIVDLRKQPELDEQLTKLRTIRNMKMGVAAGKGNFIL